MLLLLVVALIQGLSVGEFLLQFEQKRQVQNKRARTCSYVFLYLRIVKTKT